MTSEVNTRMNTELLKEQKGYNVTVCGSINNVIQQVEEKKSWFLNPLATIDTNDAYQSQRSLPTKNKELTIKPSATANLVRNATAF